LPINPMRSVSSAPLLSLCSWSAREESSASVPLSSGDTELCVLRGREVVLPLSVLFRMINIAAVMIATSAATQAIMIIIRLRLFFLLFSGVAVFIKSSSKN